MRPEYPSRYLESACKEQIPIQRILQSLSKVCIQQATQTNRATSLQDGPIRVLGITGPAIGSECGDCRELNLVLHGIHALILNVMCMMHD